MDNQARKEATRSDLDKKIEGLPVDTSPYTQYKDVEDYKQQAYGTEGHQQVKSDRGGGPTDGPTLSGDDVVAGLKGSSAMEVINRHGVN